MAPRTDASGAVRASSRGRAASCGVVLAACAFPTSAARMAATPEGRVGPPPSSLPDAVWIGPEAGPGVLAAASPPHVKSLSAAGRGSAARGSAGRVAGAACPAGLASGATAPRPLEPLSSSPPVRPAAAEAPPAAVLLPRAPASTLAPLLASALALGGTRLMAPRGVSFPAAACVGASAEEPCSFPAAACVGASSAEPRFPPESGPRRPVCPPWSHFASVAPCPPALLPAAASASSLSLMPLRPGPVNFAGLSLQAALSLAPPAALSLAPPAARCLAPSLASPAWCLSTPAGSCGAAPPSACAARADGRAPPAPREPLSWPSDVDGASARTAGALARVRVGVFIGRPACCG